MPFTFSLYKISAEAEKTLEESLVQNPSSFPAALEKQAPTKITNKQKKRMNKVKSGLKDTFPSFTGKLTTL